MAVPAHDTRDWEFAKKFDLPIIEVVKGGDVQKEAFTDCDTGIMVNSGILDGLTVEEAKKTASKHYLEENGIGHRKGQLSSSATGYSPASATGASPFRLYTARSAAMCRCR